MEIKIYVANLGKYNEGESTGKWINLPCDMETNFKELLEEIGINEFYEEYAIHDYEAPEGFEIGEYDNIENLNEIAELLEDINNYDENKLLAIIEWGYYGNIKDAIENIDDFNLLEDVTNDKEYGEYLIYDAGIFEIPENLINYMDCEKFGGDVYMEGDCFYTDYGLIEYMG